MQSYFTYCPYCTYKCKYYGAFTTHLGQKHPNLPPVRSGHPTDYRAPESAHVGRSGTMLDSDQSDISDTGGNLQTEEAVTATAGVTIYSFGGECDGTLVSRDRQDGRYDIPPVTLLTETFPGAGQCFGDAAHLVPLPESINPWTPFTLGYDFNLASWLVSSGMPHSKIKEFFNNGLHGERRSSFTSAYTLHKRLQTMDSDMGQSSWTQGQARYWSGPVEFWYRDPITIIRFLLQQRTFIGDLVYAPIREYNTAGERIFTEMHTGDWWWETQVIFTMRL